MRRQGYALLEMILVMFLLILVSVFVFFVTESGSQAYIRLHERQEIGSDLRIGLSYIDVKIKRNDASDSLMIVDRPDRDEQALVIRRTGGSDEFFTWIYVHDGYLCELTLSANQTFQPEGGSRIVAADRIELSLPKSDRLKITLIHGQSDQLSRTLLLRSEGVLP